SGSAHQLRTAFRQRVKRQFAESPPRQPLDSAVDFVPGNLQYPELERTIAAKRRRPAPRAYGNLLNNICRKLRIGQCVEASALDLARGALPLGLEFLGRHTLPKTSNSLLSPSLVKSASFTSSLSRAAALSAAGIFMLVSRQYSQTCRAALDAGYFAMAGTDWIVVKVVRSMATSAFSGGSCATSGA